VVASYGAALSENREAVADPVSFTAGARLSLMGNKNAGHRSARPEW
jgi:hypothetical protein